MGMFTARSGRILKKRKEGEGEGGGTPPSLCKEREMSHTRTGAYPNVSCNLTTRLTSIIEVGGETAQVPAFLFRSRKGILTKTTSLAKSGEQN